MSMSKKEKEKYDEVQRHATYAESKRIMGPHNYYAIANTRENALDQLTEILRSYKIPLPEPIPGLDKGYYCGYTHDSHLLNPVWFTYNNSTGKIKAHLFHPKRRDGVLFLN